MSTEHNPAIEKDISPSPGNGVNGTYDNTIASQMTREEENVARAAARFGYGPLSHVNTKEYNLPPFGGEFQPGLYKSVEKRKFANPAPLGLCAFALTTFVLSCINMGARDITAPNIVVALAFGYGGLVQLLAGMWEMAVGNTFGATALSSYGGFWLSFAIVLTPGGFNIEGLLIQADGNGASMFANSFGLFLMGWFIFTTILLFCTLRSTVAFFLLFFFLDLAFLLLGIGYLLHDAKGKPSTPIIKAGGFFGLMAAFTAWYNALAGIADSSNSFFVIPVAHFPWSPTGQARRGKTERETV
ncbi:acetate uptake transporter family protein [Aspergillus clavatus NRRL 1]|uniref:GPR/FUN34 family protein n=1 Tax=Aspergillus clavatus (strain ATCC 1007 / CBS 513.65 / DSM 816 / NCTC 3887 / NRRL 1 / QM 1276 / 107) TaxID=344612 RepID=A1CEQ1_ASPCL|nr:GPR/FUN34 family protein [Aspergillus clavatus NRRL 1]EAW11350.1 GPR/FUN34 family protein [Aspergillus clavatus NRRL 1]